MKKRIMFFTVAVTVGVQAGIYSQDFNSATHLSKDLGDGSIISGDNAFAWASEFMVLTQDLPDTGSVGNFILPTLDVGYAIDGFTASFSSYLKASGTAADGFSFNIGAISGALPYGGESGMYSGGPMLSIGFDTFSDQGIRVYTNGVLAAQNLSITPNVSAGGLWTETSIILDENGLDVIYGGTSAFTDLDVSGYIAQDGDQFGFAARTGASTEDAFIDNVNINTIPEPATLGLVSLFGGGVLLMRRIFLI